VIGFMPAMLPDAIPAVGQRWARVSLVSPFGTIAVDECTIEGRCTRLRVV